MEHRITKEEVQKVLNQFTNIAVVESKIGYKRLEYNTLTQEFKTIHIIQPGRMYIKEYSSMDDAIEGYNKL